MESGPPSSCLITALGPSLPTPFQHLPCPVHLAHSAEPGSSAFLTLKLLHSCLLLLQRVPQGHLGQRGGSEPGLLCLGAGPLPEPRDQRRSDAHPLHFPPNPPPDPHSSTMKNGQNLPPSWHTHKSVNLKVGVLKAPQKRIWRVPMPRL